MLWIIFLGIWLGLGIFQAGKFYAATQELWPNIAADTERADFALAICSIPFGLVSFFATWMVYGFKHKWRIRKIRISQKEQEA